MGAPAWDQPDAFPAKPAGDGYGYLSGRKFRGCTREELVAQCGRDRIPRINLVWTPAGERLVPAAQVPFLFEAIKRRARRRFLAYIVFGFVGIILATYFYNLPGFSQQGPARLDVLAMGLAGILGVVGGARGLGKVRAYTAASVVQELGLVRYLIWLRMRRTWTTWLIVSSVLLVGMTQLLLFMRGRPFEFAIASAGLVKPLVQQGQVWRLLTCTLVHAGPAHFVFNLLALVGLAKLVEGLTRPAYVAIVFLLSALAGSAASYAHLSANYNSVGASGALMGLIGFLAALGWRRRAALPPAFLQSALAGIVLVAALGVVGRNYVDNAAHAGGLACGVVLGLILLRREAPPAQDRPAAVAGIIAALPVVAIAAATSWLLLVG